MTDFTEQQDTYEEDPLELDALIEDNDGLSDFNKSEIAHSHGFIDPEWEEIEGSVDSDEEEQEEQDE